MNDQNIDKILVLGATGMLGHIFMQVLSKTFSITGTVWRL
jgi:aspartate-semialdehyde dehydrogenase